MPTVRRLHPIAPSLLTILFGLVACGTPELPPTEDAGTADAAVRLREPCVMAHIYLVQDELLTYYCGHEWEFDQRGRGEFQTGRCLQTDGSVALSHFSGLLALHYRNGGRAELWWNAEPVIVTPIDSGYYTQKKSDNRSYQSPEGDRAELHVLSRAECFTPPAGPRTRAEVEALEQ